MSLRKATFSATRWTTASAVVRAGVQLLQTAVLARLLAPTDFGLMTMAGVALAVTALFADLGLSSALMHHPRPDRHTLSTLYWLNLAMACALALLFAIAGWPLAELYRQSALVMVLGWLSLSFPLGALGQQFRVLAEKDLRFKQLAQNEVASALAGFSAALMAAAWLDLGVYALVAGQLVAMATNSALAWLRLSRGLRPLASFRWPLARPFMAFGLHRMGDSFWSTMLMQADVFIAGLFATPHAVATYAVPRDQSLKIANTIINPVITRVGLPVMTRLQNDLAALRAVYLKTLRLTASFNFPIYALLALFAEQVVFLLLGEQWHEAAGYLRLFAVWGLIRSTGNPSGSLIYAVGLARRAHLWNLLLCIFTLPLFWLVAKHGGLLALAWTMMVWQAGVYVLAWRFLIYPACGVGFMAYNASIAPPLAAAALASVIAWGVGCLLPSAWRLPIGALVFGCTYLALSWRLNREWITTLLEMLAPARGSMK